MNMDNVIIERIPAPRFEPLLIALLFLFTVRSLMRFWQGSGLGPSLIVPEVEPGDLDDSIGSLGWLN